MSAKTEPIEITVLRLFREFHSIRAVANYLGISYTRTLAMIGREYKAHRQVRELDRLPLSEWPNTYRKPERRKKKQTSKLKP